MNSNLHLKDHIFTCSPVTILTYLHLGNIWHHLIKSLDSRCLFTHAVETRQHMKHNEDKNPKIIRRNICPCGQTSSKLLFGLYTLYLRVHAASPEWPLVNKQYYNLHGKWNFLPKWKMWLSKTLWTQWNISLKVKLEGRNINIYFQCNHVLCNQTPFSAFTAILLVCQ